jgi:hypothetical protein
MALPWHTSVSILVAGGLVAGAVYLALRPSPAPEPPTSAATEPAARPTDWFATSPMAERDRQRRWDDEPTPESEPAPPGGSRGDKEKKDVSEAERAMAVAPPLVGVPSTPQEVVERLQQDAGKAFEDIRKRVRSDCWDTLPDDPEAPDEVKMMLSLSYGADGRVIASGINESRDEGDRAAGPRAVSPRAMTRSSTLAACLGPLVHGLDVPAPGSNLSVELSVTIP